MSGGCSFCALDIYGIRLLLSFGVVVVVVVGCCFFVVGRGYAIATVFQLYNSSDMMYDYDMIRRKTEPTRLPTQGIFHLPHHVDME